MHPIVWPLAVVLLVALAAAPRVAGGKPATAPAGPADPVEAVNRFCGALAAADQGELTRLVAVTNADEAVLHPSVGAACREVGAFAAAMRDRFAAAADGKWGVGPARATATAVVRRAGDAAVVRVTADGSTREVELVRQDGTWKLTYAGLAEILRQRRVEPLVPVDEPHRRLVDVAEALKAVTAAVRKGEYATAGAAAEAGRKAWVDAAHGANAQ